MSTTFLFGVAVLLSLASYTHAQEHQELGRMWTFENPPLDYLDKSYGFSPDQAWLDSLRLGSLRLGGEEDILSGAGSASFVSPNGLIMTNMRSVGGVVAATLDADGPTRLGDPLRILKTGFVAATLEDEVRLRTKRDGWLAAAQLVKITDVTDEVNTDVAPTDDEIQRAQNRQANRRAIIEEARRTDPQLVPQIVNLYQGGVYQLYQYKVYHDVRLVCIPHLQMAHFGGDEDNFTFPRYSMDFAFLRAFEHGRPVDTNAHYLKWRPGGAKKDELVFVSGNPRTTARLLTQAQMELERDIKIPMRIEQLTNSLRISMDPSGNAYAGEFDPENPSTYWASVRTSNLRAENDLKAARGNLRGLQNPQLMAQKTAAETAFRDRVMADKTRAEEYGDLWDRIARVVEMRRAHEVRARFHTTDASAVLGVVVAIVRSLDPAETEDNRKQARSTVESWAGATIALNYHGLAGCRDHVVRARRWLPEDDPFLTNVLAGRSAAEFVNAMAPPESERSPTWLGYAESRDALVESGWEAIRASEDTIVVAARELATLMRQNERLGAELDAEEEALGVEMARALFECYGPSVSPDATTTLRFTDGVVRGVRRNGTRAPYRTTFDGLFARNAEFDNEFPFSLPQAWLDRKDEIDMTKPVNFVSTNDISGGNSGSVVVNTSLEVVGMVIDGNGESLHNDFVFNDDIPRAVSVHVDGIMEALVKIYNADRVVGELTGR